MLDRLAEISVANQERWRVDVLNDSTAGQGLFHAYNCKFTLADEWSYGRFSSQACCELPGKLFIAKASGKDGCEHVYVASGLSEGDDRALYDIEASPIYVAWRVQGPKYAVDGGRFSLVRPDRGPWRVWCEAEPDGRVVWHVEVQVDGVWQSRCVACEALEGNWLDVQLTLFEGQLVAEFNQKQAGCFDHDAYPGRFSLQFGSAQDKRGGDEVATAFRNIYVDIVPYLFAFVDVVQGPEDVRSEDNVINQYACEPTQELPRHSEGDLIELQNGDLLLAWSEFHTGKAQDWQPARIAGKVSKDKGKTWSDARTLVERNPALKHPTPTVSLAYSRDGDLLMAHTETLAEDQAYAMVLRRSKDHGLTWSDAERISPDTGNAHQINNGCFRYLRSGRLILPAREYVNGVRWPYALYSDDDGRTWHAGARVPDPDLSDRLKRIQNVNEPCLEELADGRLLMTMRSFAGGQFFSYSDDDGQTWTKPILSPLRGICSPAAIRRIPGTDDILAIWNYDYGARSPLHSAISSDGGLTWRHLKLVEASKYYSYNYVTITFLRDENGADGSGGRVCLSYDSCPLLTALQTLQVDTDASGLRVTVLPVAWFYRNPKD